MDLTYLLTKCRLFDGVQEETIHSLFGEDFNGSIRFLKEGECIFDINSFAGNIGIILSGSVRVEKLLENGQSVTIATKKEGDLIGQAAVFSPVKVYPCRLYAVAKSTVLLLTRSEMTSLMTKSPVIMQNFLEELSSMTYFLQKKVELLSYSGIQEKIAFFLLTKYRETRERVISIPESVTNMAMVLNVSRPSLHREIKKLEAQGAIKTGYRTIEIKDESMLERLI